MAVRQKEETSGKADILITHGLVVPMEGPERVIRDGAVAVSGDRITRVGRVEDFGDIPAGRVIDARGGIVLPGLVNCHTHLPMTLFRGLADDLVLDVWLNEHMFPAEAKWINPETARLGAALACCEMLLSGTTTVGDGYFLESSVARAVADSGMRAVLAHGIIDYPAPGVVDPKKNIDKACEFVQSHMGKYPLIVPSLFCHSIYTCSEKTLREASKRARDFGVMFQVHVSETHEEVEQSKKERKESPVRYLDRLGILGEDTLCVHAVWTDEDDISILKDNGAAVACCVESNLKLGAGIAPVPAFLENRLRVGLGTDGSASNNDLDLFGEMGTMARIHKAVTLDPTVMSAQQVLHMATMGGARALGLERSIGSLAPGKQADILIIDTDQPHLTPLYDPLSHLVYAARGSDVRDVFIAGKQVVRDRGILTMDSGAIMEKVRGLGKKIREEKGA